MSRRPLVEQICSIGSELRKESFAEDHEPNVNRCADIVNQLKELTTIKSSTSAGSACSETRMNIAILEGTQIGKTLTKSIKCFQRHKRTSPSDEWDNLILSSQQLLSTWKNAASKEATIQQKKKNISEKQEDDCSTSLPSSVSIYRSRLVTQKKELYKDPPALPPTQVEIFATRCDEPPKRNKQTKILSFASTSHCSKLVKDFHPNVTPEEVLRSGSFGGTYFRTITSAVTNVTYKSKDVLQDTLDSNWISGLNKATMLTSNTYRTNINKYQVKCGGSLGMWESSGWISDIDPYGWFQWYCRFYRGRRSSDDERQISRWMKSAGFKGRFRSQLCNKILLSPKPNAISDFTISPVIRQTLLHWGIEITPHVLEQHRKRTGK